MNTFKKFLFVVALGITSVLAKAQGLFDDDERFDAEITVNYSYATYMPSKKAPYQVEKNEAHIKGKLSCQTMSFRLQTYANNPKSRGQCTFSMHCPILTGTSNYKEYDEKGKVAKEVKFPLEVSVTQTSMSEKSNKLTTTYTYTASGTNNMESLSLEIKHYDAPDGQVQPLIPNYVIWLSGGKEFKYAALSPTGNGSGQHWDDFKERLVPSDGPFGIGIPYSLCDADKGIEGSEVYEQLLIQNYKELDAFLLDPKGSFTIKASGKRYNLNEGNQEIEGKVDVEIKLTTHFELHDLKISK